MMAMSALGRTRAARGGKGLRVEAVGRSGSSSSSAPHRRGPRQRHRIAPARVNFGKDDVLGGFIDLANLVSGDGAAKKLNAFEELAYKMGGEVYVDINGWHLYVKDIKVAGSTKVKMHNVLAQQIGEKILAR